MRSYRNSSESMNVNVCIIFTLPVSPCRSPGGVRCHPDPGVSWPLSALTLLSELEELASISPWLLVAD